MDVAADFLSSEIETLGERQLRQQLRHAGANHVRPQQLAKLSIGNDLHKTSGFAEALSLAVG